LKKYIKIITLKKFMSDDLVANAYHKAMEAAKEGKFTEIESHLSKQPSRLFINAFLKPLLNEQGERLLSWFNKTSGLSPPIRNLAKAILIGRNLGQEWFEEYAVRDRELRIGYIKHCGVKCTKKVFDKLAFQRITPMEIDWMMDKFYITMDQWLERVEMDQPLNWKLIHPNELNMYYVYQANFHMMYVDIDNLTETLKKLFGDLDQQTIDCWMVGRIENCEDFVDPHWIDGDEYLTFYRNCDFIRKLHFSIKGVKTILNFDQDLGLNRWIELALRPDEIGGHILKEMHTRKRRNSI